MTSSNPINKDESFFEVSPYPRSPEAVRDVHRLLRLLKRERQMMGTERDDMDIYRLQVRVSQLDPLEVVEIFLNNAPLLSRALMK